MPLAVLWLHRFCPGPGWPPVGPSDSLTPFAGRTAMQIALEARNLVKQYPGVVAVNDVSFAVVEGTCFGLLGPNGAGKTTTVEIIEGVTPATSGEIFYFGEPAGRRFAYVAAKLRRLNPVCSVYENLPCRADSFPSCPRRV